MLGHTLTLGTNADWLRFTFVLCLRLTAQQRSSLALACLKSLDPEDAINVAQDALGGAGSPLPTFLDPVDDAIWWVSLASLGERRAYATAAARSLPWADKLAFIDILCAEVQA